MDDQTKSNTAPLVSISVTAYQHAPFLGSCLKSILEQECDFPFELLLGEDCSTDGTREIAQRYADLHPGVIRLFLHDRSKVMRIDGRLTGRHNLLNNMAHARGRYFCHVDGDDKWTDPHRLRIMVERMESEPGTSMAFHNADNVWPDGTRRPYFDDAVKKDHYDRREIAINNIVPTAGAIWRWNLVKDIPRAWLEAPYADWAMNIHFAGLGPVAYVDRIMSDRNVHTGSSMGQMDPIRTNRTTALAYEVLHEQVVDDLPALALERWRKLVTDGFDLAINSGRRDDARWFLAHSGRLPKNAVPLRMRSRWWALVHFPRAMAWYKQMRSSA